MVLVHEIIKIVTDLQEQGELELALRVSAEYMDRLESAELRFMHLAITASLGQVDQVMNLLEGSLETDRWFSTWFLQRSPEFSRLAGLPRYQRILQAAGDKEAQYWQDKVMEPVLQVPASGQPPYPLLIAIHGNGFNPQHSASQWACAAEMGWLVFHPMAKRLVGFGSHWWDRHEENRAIIEEQASQLLDGYQIDPQRVILGGFSKGGETAMVLALLGFPRARGFITVGSGGYYHLEPERWRPLLEQPPEELRGVAMYSPYDLGRAGGVDQTLEMMGAAGVEIRLEKYPAEGHVFPDDFPARLKGAFEFVLQLAS